jgi:hypothetical protein
VSTLNRWSTYLSLIKLMHLLGVDFEDRMSYKEFDYYDATMHKANERKDKGSDS